MKKGWPIKRLAEISDKITDGSHNPPKGVPYSDYLMLSSKNVFDDDFHYEAPRYLTAEQFQQEDKRTGISPGDVLLTIVGTIGRSAVVPPEAPKITLQRSVAVIRPKRDIIEPRFLMYSFIRRNVELNDQARGVAQKGIYLEAIRELGVAVPPLPEQQRIVGILDEAFAGIATAKANAEKNLQNARALFDSHLHSVFTQRGDGWKEKRLEEICSFSSGGTPSKKKSSYWDGDIPWVSGRDMKSTRLSDSLLHISQSAVEDSSTHIASAGTLLILVRGMGLAHGAQIAELMVPCAFNQDIRGIHPEPDLVPRYLLFALRDRINSSDNVLSNAAHGTLKINSEELKNLMIPVLTRSHQQEVVTTIDSLSEETQRLEFISQQKLAALEALKKSLLHQAFTGNL